ncbi:MAG: TM2 domain-containing protein [Planctomycetia bacterium]|nr:TM2 domain-containing protein [Planctomycetia bacterium]
MNLPRKSRTTYILLAFFFGGLGIHNFYAKRTGTAVIQLLLTVLTLGAGGVITLPWSLIDMICIKKDGFGMDFE